jgi:hypothetical protein
VREKIGLDQGKLDQNNSEKKRQQLSTEAINLYTGRTTTAEIRKSKCRYEARKRCEKQQQAIQDQVKGNSGSSTRRKTSGENDTAGLIS